MADAPLGDGYDRVGGDGDRVGKVDRVHRDGTRARSQRGSAAEPPTPLGARAARPAALPAGVSASQLFVPLHRAILLSLVVVVRADAIGHAVTCDERRLDAGDEIDLLLPRRRRRLPQGGAPLLKGQGRRGLGGVDFNVSVVVAPRLIRDATVVPFVSSVRGGAPRRRRRDGGAAPRPRRYDVGGLPRQAGHGRSPAGAGDVHGAGPLLGGSIRRGRTSAAATGQLHAVAMVASAGRRGGGGGEG
mmetsp:Transcript_29018/g.85872  ORF Transcript_29018/g.85872 Transcript_29018/m.85872 type:complete len:245 (+) Transcript_29018:1498-2232(+)